MQSADVEHDFDPIWEVEYVEDSTSGPVSMTTLPAEMVFSDAHLMTIIIYSMLFVVSAIGNFTVFINLLQTRRRRRSRVGLFILHLTFADLFVTLVMLPLEIVWHATVSWEAGDVACRVLMFCRAFGFYLSSFVLIAISLDRYFAVAQPLSIQTADRRGRVMLSVAWALSAAASVPQSFIFHVEAHPLFPEWQQCVTFNSFSSQTEELFYNLFTISAIYVIPLAVIIVTYAMILAVISRKVRQNKVPRVSLKNRFSDIDGLRSTGNAKIERAKSRTLRMTIVIVSVFIICWTPYFVISAWYWFKPETAMMIDVKVQKGLFAFAISSSCVNPIVYGVFSTAFRCRNLKNLFQTTHSTGS